MPKTRLTLLALTLGASLMLAGCESSEERAEKFYQSALALMEAGQEEQAMLEFRNVFKYNGTHKEARRTYADLLLKRGEKAQAMGQYLRLIEQYPNEPEVRWILAENALLQGNWDEARRHGEAAQQLDPAALRSRVLGLALEYQKIKTARGRGDLKPVMAQVQLLQDEAGYNDILARVQIDYALSSEDPMTALSHIDAALAQNPDALDMHQMRVRLLAQSGDTEATGAQLQTMAAQFPDNVDIRRALVQWYMSRQDFAGAETYLRQIAGPLTGAPEDHVAVVQLVQSTRGAEAAQAELERLVEANAGTENAVLYAALSATIDFENGREEAAIARMRTMLETAPDGSRKRESQAVLARMLDTTGARDEARTLVDAILEADSGLVPALKLRAAWLIEEDKPGQAVVVLRKALDQRPDDAETLTLMAAAHEREGNIELATERLALAVQASGNAPAESLRYVQALLSQGRTNSAVAVLEDALRRAPVNVVLLTRLAELRMSKSEWGATQEIIDALRSIGTPEAAEAAQRLQADALLGQNKIDESLAFLGEAVAGAEGDAATRSAVLMVQTQVRAGRLDEARGTLDAALAATPQDSGLRLMSATLDAMRGKMDLAEAGYRALIAEDPAAEPPARLLVGLLAARGRPTEARAALDAALAAQPASAALRLMKADFLQQDGDIAGALALYDALYTQDSDSVVLANNLASILATYHGDDAASLDRAYAISRRLRGVEIPAVQDTYGWIEFLRGNAEESLPYLEAAAKGLPDDPFVQVHLGLAYAKLAQVSAARKQLTRALEMAGSSPLPQFQQAREALAALPGAGQ